MWCISWYHSVLVNVRLDYSISHYNRYTQTTAGNAWMNANLLVDGQKKVRFCACHLSTDECSECPRSFGNDGAQLPPHYLVKLGGTRSYTSTQIHTYIRRYVHIYNTHTCTDRHQIRFIYIEYSLIRQTVLSAILLLWNKFPCMATACYASNPPFFCVPICTFVWASVTDNPPSFEKLS